MACTLSNKCAKNLSKQTVLLQLIIKNVVTCFFGTQCTIWQAIIRRNMTVMCVLTVTLIRLKLTSAHHRVSCVNNATFTHRVLSQVIKPPLAIARAA